MKTHPFLQKIKEKGFSKKPRILFAEGTEERVKEASLIIQKEDFADVLLLKNPQEDERFEEMLDLYVKIRGVEKESARSALAEPHLFGTLLLQAGYADIMISGPSASSKTRILPALQIIKTKSEGKKASGAFLMLLPDTVTEDAGNGGVLLFADCALNVDPNEEELAQIAIDTADTAIKLGLKPKVAMLSFSTAGSSNHPHVLKIQNASKIAQSLRPDLLISQDIQADSALIDAIGEAKAKESIIAGHANVLIFPDLEAGNIAYKLVERLANAQAIGPIVQGLNKPVHELSRGCNTQDIVNLAMISVTLWD